MSRIFATLALFAIVMLAITVLLGLPVDLNGQVSQLRSLTEKMDNLKSGLATNEDNLQEVEQVRGMIEENRLRFANEKKLGSLHKLMGIATAIMVMLVCSIAVTYFVGTSRWCREVVETYDLNGNLWLESQRLKRRAFPWAVLGMGTAVVISALGAASDPGTGLSHTADWVTPHLGVAILGSIFIGYCFYILWETIRRNHAVIELVMQCVQECRAAKGLEKESGLHAPLPS